MRILIFNWKDVRHPAAGGAEVFAHEIARRWVRWGDEVTLFSQQVPDAPAHDVIDGVRIVRGGGRFTVYRAARKWFRTQPDPFDVLVDIINTRPFLAPLFSGGVPVVSLIYQVADEVWNEEMPPPVALLGRHILEPRWLSHYRQVPTATISESTAADLRHRGFRNVVVVPIGLNPGTRSLFPKEAAPTLLSVGRLVRTKRPDHALEAFRIVRRALPDAQLWIVGDGYMREALAGASVPGVTLFGSVDDARKYELMARAHLLLVPGVREGWGLVVTEAASVGTPAVAYRIPGLVDSVRDGVTGCLVDPKPEHLARASIALLGESARRAQLGDAARQWVMQFDWDETAKRVHEILREAAS